jgi:uncharacterized membrane protein YdfJ with MMPL/SSD domain
MNMMFWVLLVMIVILVVLIVFIGLVLLWLKRQQKLRFPVKSKVVMRKERTLAKKLAGSAALIRAVGGSGAPQAKRAQAVTASSKIAAVTPIRIATYQPNPGHSADKEEDKDNDDHAKDDKKHAERKPIAKPVQRDSELKKDDKKSKKDSKSSKSKKD